MVEQELQMLTAGSGNTPPVSPPQGNNGGMDNGLRWSWWWSDGSGAGGSGPTGLLERGGAGAPIRITGSNVSYAGGGGGQSTTVAGGAGGAGGGGAGASNLGRNAGTANTGGGGGGCMVRCRRRWFRNRCSTCTRINMCKCSTRN